MSLFQNLYRTLRPYTEGQTEFGDIATTRKDLVDQDPDNQTVIHKTLTNLQSKLQQAQRYNDFGAELSAEPKVKTQETKADDTPGKRYKVHLKNQSLATLGSAFQKEIKALEQQLIFVGDAAAQAQAATIWFKTQENTDTLNRVVSLLDEIYTRQTKTRKGLNAIYNLIEAILAAAAVFGVGKAMVASAVVAKTTTASAGIAKYGHSLWTSDCTAGKRAVNAAVDETLKQTIAFAAPKRS